MNFSDAQQDMRLAYFGGAPGMLTSAIAWLVAGLVALNITPKHALLTLYVGGVLIHPVAVLACKALGRSGAHKKGNPLGTLAMESTFLLMLGIALAFCVFLYRAQWFFPAMMLVIGGRYLVFSTMFGMRVYWTCGATLAAGGFALAFLDAPMAAGAFAGSAIEMIFAAILFATSRTARPAS